MSAQLSNLPSEVIEMVVCLLDYQEICNLRLVSRAIDVASTQARYKSFFGCKTVELDSTAILRPAAITKYSYFVGLLQDLTLTGTEKGQVTDRFSSRDADRLCMALRNLRKLHEQSKQYGLRSLTTGVTEEASTPSRVVSRSTPRSGAGASAVRTTLRVVNDSDIPIEKIDLLYHSSAYSVPCCIFKGLFEPIQPSTNWSILRSLSLSLTHHANNGAEAGLEDTDYDTFDFAVRESAEAGTRRVQALVHFFSLIPNIEELSLHWYDKRLKSLAFTVAEAIENYWFDQVSLVVSFHNLKHLVLRGLRLSQQTLQKVLIAPSLQQVHLEYIRLTGSLRPIIDILTGPNTAIAQFFLDDIYTRELVHFSVEGRPKFPWSGRVPGPSTVLRKGEKVRLPLKYGYAGGHSLLSDELTNFKRIRKEEFGWS